MINFLIGLFMGTKYNNQNLHYQYPVHKTNKPIQKQTITFYEYWKEFDNEEPTLEQAYKFYEDNSICHIAKDGMVKCYIEFTETSNDGIIPKNYLKNI